MTNRPRASFLNFWGAWRARGPAKGVFTLPLMLLYCLLCRGVSGLWTAGEGRVSRHSDADTMFVPQVHMYFQVFVFCGDHTPSAQLKYIKNDRMHRASNCGIPFAFFLFLTG